MNSLDKQTHLHINRCFVLKHMVQIHLNIYPIYQQVSECLMQKSRQLQSGGCVPSQQQFFDHEQISYTKHVLMVS